MQGEGTLAMEHEGTPAMEHEVTLTGMTSDAKPAPWDDATLTTYQSPRLGCREKPRRRVCPPSDPVRGSHRADRGPPGVS
jgi:hypothetical protein